MDKLKAPDALNFDATDLAHIWKKWKEEFSLFVDLAMVESDEKLKIKMLKYLIGTCGREVYEMLSFTDDEEKHTLKYILEKFDTYCNPLKNESVERFKFISRNQQSGETIYNFATELKL